MTADVVAAKPCRSSSPDGDPCARLRGHVRLHRRATDGRKWEDGVRSAACWQVVDDGHMSEGDLASWGRIFR